tara:strand:- start:982 stop:1158 length:177 start_codon:yes stop_codon:yes gene_type:complete
VVVAVEFTEPATIVDIMVGMVDRVVVEISLKLELLTLAVVVVDVKIPMDQQELVDLVL